MIPSEKLSAVGGLLFAALLASVLVTSSPVSGNLRAGNAPPEGFRSLFNGKTLAGWTPMPRPQGLPKAANKDGKPAGVKESFYERSLKSCGKWTVQNGALIGEQDPPGSGLGGYLVSNEAFGDFELLIDAKLDWAVDTGVLVRTTPAGNVGYQILIDHRRSGGIGGFYGNGVGGFHALGFAVDVVQDAQGKPIGLKEEDLKFTKEPLTQDKRKPLTYAATFAEFQKTWKFGDWNTFKIRCEGELPHLTTWINGVKIAELELDKAALPNFDKKAVAEKLGRRGRISLEVHSNGPNDKLGQDRWAPGAVCRWRHLYIKELGASAF